MEYRGYTVTQSSYNNHVAVFENGKMIMHVNCVNKLDEKGLQNLVDELLLIAENAEIHTESKSDNNELN